MTEETSESTEETPSETVEVTTEVVTETIEVVTETASEETTVAEDSSETETEATVVEGTELTLGEGAPAESEEEVRPRPKPIIRGKIDKFGVAMGTGRRKTSVARVRIKKGKGKFTINGRELDDFLTLERDRKMVQAPLVTTDQLGKLDVWVRVNGGGTTGQTGAIVLGIARALQAVDPESHYQLADAGYLTRDSRMVERKKYGFKKARKSFQFSKR